GAAGVLADAFGDVGGGDDAGVGAQAEDQAADPARGRGAQGDAEPAAGQLADVGADVVLGDPPGGRFELQGDPQVVLGELHQAAADVPAAGGAGHPGRFGQHGQVEHPVQAEQ